MRAHVLFVLLLSGAVAGQEGTAKACLPTDETCKVDEDDEMLQVMPAESSKEIEEKIAQESTGVEPFPESCKDGCATLEPTPAQFQKCLTSMTAECGKCAACLGESEEVNIVQKADVMQQRLKERSAGQGLSNGEKMDRVLVDKCKPISETTGNLAPGAKNACDMAPEKFVCGGNGCAKLFGKQFPTGAYNMCMNKPGTESSMDGCWNCQKNPHVSFEGCLDCAVNGFDTGGTWCER